MKDEWPTPPVCVICKLFDETIGHLFVVCQFSMSIKSFIKSLLIVTLEGLVGC